jgi:hypothetical protein
MKTSHAKRLLTLDETHALIGLESLSGPVTLQEKTIGSIYSALPPEERPYWLLDRIAFAGLCHCCVELSPGEASDLIRRIYRHSADPWATNPATQRTH